MLWHFGPFQLDLANACLWRAEQPVPLRPKTFALLAYLVQHAEQLVTKEALFEAVWPETAVSEGVLKTSISELRRALGETAKAPQWIATVQGRGYRFVAPVTPGVPTPAMPGSARPAPLTAAVGVLSPLPHLPDHRPVPELVVEREAALARLHTALGQAQQGVRQVVLVSGEPGIGKTTVVEAFVAQAQAETPLWVARGQCVAHYGSEEAYLPILDALGQLCRGPAAGLLVGLLRQQAPTWLVQLPWLLTPEDRERFQDELWGAARERMLRELTEVVDALTAETPLLLLLEDLHWSDAATVDLLAMLARRRTPARLLVLGTYRPVEVIVQGHPLRAVMPELQRHGHASEVALAPLSAAAVAAYLTRRFAGPQFPAALGQWLHQHTDGNPLFLVTLVAALVTRGVLAEQAGRWQLVGELDTVAEEVPEGLRPLLEQQLDVLPAAERQVVEVGSVAGVTFSAAAVAAGLEAPVTEIEGRCEALVRQQVMRPVGLETWPDGTVAGRYAFVHALYQQEAYERLGLGQRVHLHQRLGVRLEQAYGAQSAEIAVELAVHFERSHDLARAVQYWQQAAENAVRRSAHQEVIGAVRRALALLPRLPDTPERTHRELALHLPLGVALTIIKGFAAPEVLELYAHARALCQQVGDTPHLTSVLQSLHDFSLLRAELQTARELAEQLLDLARRQQDIRTLAAAHHQLGALLFFMGAYAPARTHCAQGIACYMPRSQPLTGTVEDSRLVCLTYDAHALWCLGYPTQALARNREAIAWAQELAHPFSLGQVLFHATRLHMLRRETAAAQACNDQQMALSTAQGFVFQVARGAISQGWLLALQGQEAAGIARMQEGLAAYDQTGTQIGRPTYLAQLAAVYGQCGQTAHGLQLCAEACTLVETTGERYYEAEIHRLKGAICLQQPAPDVLQAEACFQQAMAIARRQQARSWELRAATSLARLWQQQGKQAEARALLAPIYHWFTEGFDTADLQDARALLEAVECS